MLSSFSISFVKHSEITDLLIDKIIALKQQHWLFSYESQKDWLSKNIDGDDYHLLIKDSDGNILAYLNLVNRLVNGRPVLGIGNVCVNKVVINGGVGTLLMQISKFYSKQLSLDLVLLCNINLVPFYKKCSFYQYQNNAYINGVLFDKCVMFLDRAFESEAEIHLSDYF